MGLVSKVWTLAALAAGAALTSQFPEFAQQYRQRLGGAVDELAGVVGDFDADAQRSGLDRQGAISQLKMSPESLPRDRGHSMERTIIRFERLTSQQAALEAAPPLMRPVHVLRYPDTGVLDGAWSDFEPAVPLTPAGGIWAAIGGLITAFLARMPVALYRRRKRRGDRLIGVDGAPGGKDVQIAGGPTGSPSLLEQLVREERSDVDGDTDGDYTMAGDRANLREAGHAGTGSQQARRAEQSGMPVLERIALQERLVGEIDERGRFVTPPRQGGAKKDQA